MTEADKVSLLPCPFCGCNDPSKVYVDENNTTAPFYVDCYNCEASGPSAIRGWNLTKESAVEAWNTRTATLSATSPDKVSREEAFVDNCMFLAEQSEFMHIHPVDISQITRAIYKRVIADSATLSNSREEEAFSYAFRYAYCMDPHQDHNGFKEIMDKYYQQYKKERGE